MTARWFFDLVVAVTRWACGKADTADVVIFVLLAWAVGAYLLTTLL